MTITPPGTPPSKGNFSLQTTEMLPRAKRQRFDLDTPLFPQNTIQETVEDIFFKNSFPISFGKSYVLGANNKTVIKQIKQKDCGAFALLMLFSDILREKMQNNFTMNFRLSSWINGASTIGEDQIIAGSEILNFNKYSQELKPHYYTFPGTTTEKTPSTTVNSAHELLNLLALKIQNTAHSIILSIQHPRIKGHWVVIDQINDTNVTFRDSMLGVAHAVTRAEFTTTLPDDELVKCLYL
ncbi:hypothetical protein N9Y92_03555 [Chlamydiales bacterium]|nr:hypothetical protein [Chlamydiales bacterium]